MKPLYLALISVHGLIRGEEMELGRDADTGGQTLYVVELAKALAQRPEVGRVDLFTRLIVDDQIDPIYQQQREKISDKTWIIRIKAGQDEYIPKEQLWDHLDEFADNMIAYIRNDHLNPALIHSHYADAGYVAVRVASQLGKPLVHTGHSLGRDKRKRLLASGLRQAEVEEKYNMIRRIEAEEEVLGAADLVFTSTQNEIESQYSLYDHYQPDSMLVNPPGLDLKRFHPPGLNPVSSPVIDAIKHFLRHPEKPVVLAISRPDERKNITVLLDAFGRSEKLRGLANLVIISGNRDRIEDLGSIAQRVMTDILFKVDRYNLYGSVAYPKAHKPHEVPEIYRFAAQTRGIFINPALTEPFGLTLLEASASGLPLVATQEGGPQDIIGNCKNGFLVDPLDPDEIARYLIQLLDNRQTWQEKSENGQLNVHRFYTWESHVSRYLKQVKPLIENTRPLPKKSVQRRHMLFHDRAIFSDIDQTLLGDPEALKSFNALINNNRRCTTFGIASSRNLNSALGAIRKHGIPMPDVLIAGMGSEIYYAPKLVSDVAWRRHIDHLWTPRGVKRALAEVPGLTLQGDKNQGAFKVSYFLDRKIAPSLREINSLLHQNDQTVNVTLSFERYLDITPIRVSKGLAMRYFADQWNIPVQNILAAGGSGADEDMLTGNTLGVVVANRYNEELSQLVDRSRIFFAQEPHAAGILEAIEHFNFFSTCQAPDRDQWQRKN
ncbi:MAG: glycosyltransferase [Magnetococcales bacterium]|nr:glycosyltransferase [Magnetococcales bacterium]